MSSTSVGQLDKRCVPMDGSPAGEQRAQAICDAWSVCLWTEERGEGFADVRVGTVAPTR